MVYLLCLVLDIHLLRKLSSVTNQRDQIPDVERDMTLGCESLSKSSSFNTLGAKLFLREKYTL